jgi:hypothetical protein
MPTIDSPELTIAPDRLGNLATISVSCELQFTEFEVNAMSMLGLRYRLHCRLFNKDLWDVEPVAILEDQVFPRATGAPVSRHEHVVFETVRVMSDLRIHVFSKDELLAELKLENEETGEQVINQTRAVATDLTP